MNQEALSNLIGLGEGFTTEFKRAGASNLGREICAFANATGGTILLGVADNRRDMRGFQPQSPQIRSPVNGPFRPLRWRSKAAGKVLCVRVPAPAEQTLLVSGASSSSARVQAASRCRGRRSGEFFYKEGLIHFDETACDKFSLERDLDEENWPLFRRRAKIPAAMEPVTALRNLHLIGEDGRMTQAGAWVAGARHPQVQYQRRCRLRSLHGN